jgi:hypothetical protein
MYLYISASPRVTRRTHDTYWTTLQRCPPGEPHEPGIVVELWILPPTLRVRDRLLTYIHTYSVDVCMYIDDAPEAGLCCENSLEAMHISSICMTYARFVCTYVLCTYVHTQTQPLHTPPSHLPLRPSLAKPTPPAPSLRSGSLSPCQKSLPSMSRVGCCTAHWLAGSQLV